MNKFKVVTCLPCYKGVEPVTVNSLLEIISHSGGAVVDHLYCDGMWIDKARNAFVEAVLDGVGLPRLLGVEYDHKDVTHLLFLDSDMTWPTYTVQRLLEDYAEVGVKALNKHYSWERAHADMTVIGGLAFTKTPPYTPVSYNFTSLHPALKEPLAEIPDTGLLQVDGTGMGCTLIPMETFRFMAKQIPGEWFKTDDCGEDIHFARRLKKLGVPHYLDCDLRCGHIGQQLVTHEHWQLTKELETGCG